MATIPMALVQTTWIRFCKETPENRQALIDDFCKRQPHVHRYAEDQDKEWFPDSRPMIRMLALFVWLVFMSANRGNVPTVSEQQIADLLAREIAKMDTMDEESEIKATELGVKDLVNHPQLELSRFVFGFLTHKEDNPELTPTNIKAAYSHMDTVIRAFDAAQGKSALRLT
jgi:hypothetical protein